MQKKAIDSIISLAPQSILKLINRYKTSLYNEDFGIYNLLNEIKKKYPNELSKIIIEEYQKGDYSFKLKLAGLSSQLKIVEMTPLIKESLNNAKEFYSKSYSYKLSGRLVE